MALANISYQEPFCSRLVSCFAVRCALASRRQHRLTDRDAFAASAYSTVIYGRANYVVIAKKPIHRLQLFTTRGHHLCHPPQSSMRVRAVM